MSKNRLIKIGVLTIVALLAVLKWPSVFQDYKHKKSIKNNREEYTKNGGRVDRWHATPGWASNLRKKIQYPIDIPGSPDYGLVTYGQAQRKFGIVDKISKTYVVKKNISQEEKESVALTIFLEISRKFEEHQELTDFITGSSYDEADLFSNIIGFYRAVRGYSLEAVKDYLDPLWPDSSLAIYKQQKIDKNDQIGKILIHNENDSTYTQKYPYPFNQIKTIRKGKFYGNRGILLREAIDPKPSEQLEFLGYTTTWFDRYKIKKWYEKVVSEYNVKQWLQTMDNTLYADSKVKIEQKKMYREIIVYK